MANNALSFNRFTTLPANIAEYGATKEELALQRGTPDPNPVHSAMPARHVSETRLSLSPTGSDNARLARPLEPNQNPFQGPRRLVVLSRRAIKKLESAILEELLPVIEDSEEQNLANMRQSLRCTVGMREQARTLNTWAEQVEVEALSGSRG
jgi:hypothetical protein